MGLSVVTVSCTVCRLGLRLADVAATFLARQPTLRLRRFVPGGGDTAVIVHLVSGMPWSGTVTYPPPDPRTTA
jgi:hypothetical protein